jgi:hypothetical protein
MTASLPHHACSACGALDAAAALEATRHFVVTERLIGESHLGVSLRRCPGCDGDWLVVFTERIDWKDGEDPQYVTYVPVTRAESDALDSENALEQARRFGDGRRFLVFDWPSDGERSVAWTTTASIVGLHD